MTTPLWRELRAAIDRLKESVVEFVRATEFYEAILDRISGLGPEQAGERFTLDERIERAYMDHWRAGEAVDYWASQVQRLKARYDAEARRRAAQFHGVGARPWSRPAIQRRPALPPARLLPLRAMWAPGPPAGRPFSYPVALFT